MFKNIRSIRGKILFGTLPTVMIAFFCLALIVTLSAKTIIETEVASKVEKQVELSKNQIVSHLIGHQKLPITLAKTVESIGIDASTKGPYIELVKKLPLTNEDTLGTGIFMADLYDGKYYCPYAYKDGSSITYTEDYFVDNTNEGWYKIGDTQNPVAWSDPYYDPASNITMITAASPIRDAAGKLIGVTTADLDFTNIQKIVSEIKVGKEGYAILLTKDGSYLGKGLEQIKADDAGTFPNITKDANLSLAALGTEVLKNRNGISSFEDEKGKNKVYYTEITETGWIVLLTIPDREIFAPISNIMFKIITVTMGALIILVFLLVLVARNITHPLRPLMADIEAISKGEFSRTINVLSIDEIGQISQSVNKMTEELRHILRDISISSTNVAATAEELEASASQNGLAVEQVASAATEISGSNMEIAKVTGQLEKAITYVRDLSQNIVEQMKVVTDYLANVDNLSKESGESVSSLISAMTIASDDTNKLSLVMTKLTDQSSQINSIVVAIQGISNQTNLLALNASIEAARAGESGRGFAVVADEIRKLAEQSSKSANDISQIITEVGRVTKTANDSTSSVVGSIGASKSALSIVGQTFEKIISSISEINNLIREADHLAEKIKLNSDQANHSAGDLTNLTDKSAEEASSIAAATEEQLASVEEQTAATASLAQIAEELKEKVNIFKI